MSVKTVSPNTHRFLVELDAMPLNPVEADGAIVMSDHYAGARDAGNYDFRAGSANAWSWRMIHK
jgi:hypothetical protein